jgi:hypothetical protein
MVLVQLKKGSKILDNSNLMGNPLILDLGLEGISLLANLSGNEKKKKEKCDRWYYFYIYMNCYDLDYF